MLKYFEKLQQETETSPIFGEVSQNESNNKTSDHMKEIGNTTDVEENDIETEVDYVQNYINNNPDVKFYKGVPYVPKKVIDENPEKYNSLYNKPLGGFIIANRQKRIYNNPIVGYFQDTIPIHTHAPLHYRLLGQIEEEHIKYYVLQTFELTTFAFWFALIATIIKLIISFN